MRKKIALLGSTGSIGTSTLKVIQHLPDTYEVTALAAHRNIELLFQQISTFKPKIVAVFDAEKAAELKKMLPNQQIVTGEEGLVEVAAHGEVNFVVMAIVGSQALKPTLAAIEAGKPIGLANKEVLVAAGELITRRAREKGVPLIPIDSEHSALFQCLEGRKPVHVRRLILTASGGPFRTYSLDQLREVNVESALAHPTWKMGPKVTIDSSTLMNKGLEMIEARWLFDMPPEKIDVVVHPQSIVHSLVEMIDGSILAQLSEPDMIYPIQYAMSYPERKPGMFPPFDFVKNGKWEFFAPDHAKFPALELVHETLRTGGSAPCYLNGANEELVARFLNREIAWIEIVLKLEKLLDRHRIETPDSLEAVFEVDRRARQEARAA